MTGTAARLEALGIELPEPWRLPDGVRRAFEIVRVHDGTAHVAGHGPVRGTEILMHGKVGDGLTVEEAHESAGLTALAITSSLRDVLGSLDDVTWLRATVYVNAVSGLEGPSLTQIADGFSDVVTSIFEDRGPHARATLGVASLAFNVPTIVEATVAVR